MRRFFRNNNYTRISDHSIYRFPYGKAFLFSTGFLGINVIWALFNNFVPPFLAGLGLSATLIGFVMTWDNYLNMFVQPIVGNRSDRTRTRIGRRKPWLLVGAPLAAIFFVAIPLEKSLLTIIPAILMTNIGMTLFRSPTVSLLGDLFTPKERSIAGSILDLMGGVGVIIALTGGWLLFSRLELGLITTFAFGSLVMLAAILLVLLRLNEPQMTLLDEKTERDKGLIINLRQILEGGNRSGFKILLAFLCGFLGVEALLAWLSSFGLFSLGINPGRMAGIAVSFALAFMIFTIPAGSLATHFGRRRTILTGFMLMTFLLSLGYFIHHEVTLVVLLALGGFSWALVSVNALPMVYDFAGESHIGASTGLYYMAVNIAAAVGPQVVGFLIDVTGKNYRMMFVVSAIFMAMATLFLSRINDRNNRDLSLSIETSLPQE